MNIKEDLHLDTSLAGWKPEHGTLSPTCTPKVKATSYSDILSQIHLYSQNQNSIQNLGQLCDSGIFFVIEQTQFSLDEKWDQYILNL